MDQVLEFFRKLFDVADWPPRWHCGNWTEFHGWFYIISDLLIWSAYFAIPLAILRYISKRTQARFMRAYFLFAAFILACGSTHLLDAITFWFPAYRLNALVRFITGVVSWITVFYLIRILPVASSLRPYEELEKEVNERKRIEEELKQTNEQLTIAQEIGKIGHWQWNLENNELVWSSQLKKIFGLEAQPDYDTYVSMIHPDDREATLAIIQHALETGNYQPGMHRIITTDGEEKMIQARGEVIRDSSGKMIRMIGTGQDITEQQQAQIQLLERTRELEMSNAELKKFAYVASHDLQEPLRKIMTFTSLLEKELPDRTGNVKLFMEKIGAASGRMQKLIEDVLRFSSIRLQSAAFENVDLNEVLQQVLSDLEIQISETGATITYEPLPVIEAVHSQMGQLFQNLVNNAIKFRKEGQAPVVRIKSQIISGKEINRSKPGQDLGDALAPSSLYRDTERFVQIDITDNGIGFDKKYAGKIFEIFQRLHNGGYGGTGIGLAICKKIVENHHGLISAESKPEGGATFSVMLPLSQKRFFQQDTGKK